MNETSSPWLCSCGRQAAHSINNKQSQCCKCYVENGNPPADWHVVCMTTALSKASAEIQRLQRYVAHLSLYGEQHHPLDVSADDCNDECITAHAIQAGIEFRNKLRV